MKTRNVHVASSLGLHARLAAQVVHVASKLSSLEASGPDEAEALDALSGLIEIDRG